MEAFCPLPSTHLPLMVPGARCVSPPVPTAYKLQNPSTSYSFCTYVCTCLTTGILQSVTSCFSFVCVSTWSEVENKLVAGKGLYILCSTVLGTGQE